MPKQKTNCQL